jgi:hypothetical protein
VVLFLVAYGFSRIYSSLIPPFRTNQHFASFWNGKISFDGVMTPDMLLRLLIYRITIIFYK